MKYQSILLFQSFLLDSNIKWKEMYPVFIVKENKENEQGVTTISELGIEEKIKALSKFVTDKKRSKPKYMLFMIMYDIENNKIRTYLAKYLIKKGCMRIQKSVYIAKGSKRDMLRIGNTLQEINEAYENQDSIFVLPIPQEKFNNMKIIGKNLTFEIVTKPKNVLIF